MPAGGILHGSRSTVPRSAHAEFVSTDDYAQSPSNVLSWSVTIGEDELSEHMPIDRWGWNAFQASTRFVAAEFAQPGAGGQYEPITAGMVRAYSWWWVHRVLARWPGIPPFLPTHSEVEHLGLIGHSPSGKTDVFPWRDPRADELRMRLAAELHNEYGLNGPLRAIG